MEASQLRVALFTGNYNYVRDGANQALNRLVGYLLRQGAAVRIYSPVVEHPAFPATGDLVGVPALPVPGRAEYRFPISLPRSIRRDISEFNPNILHVASPEILGHRAVSLALRRNLPVVASVHTRFETYFRYYGLAFLEPLAQLLRNQRMSYDVGIWSRGIDREIFQPGRRDLAWRQSIGIADDDVVIGFVGRLVMEKGLDIFADTIDHLNRRQVRHKVLVIGEGPARDWFEKRLPQGVFVGFQKGEELGRAVASMDILFNPSVTETFGNVTLEAMAAGLPVVAARATGSESLVEDGVTGRLIQPGRTKAFATALQHYCENEEARRTIGAAGLAASEPYGWDQVNQVLVDGYMRVVRSHEAGIKAPRQGPVP